MTREKWRTVLRQGFQQSAEQLEQKKQGNVISKLFKSL